MFLFFQHFESQIVLILVLGQIWVFLASFSTVFLLCSSKFSLKAVLKLSLFFDIILQPPFLRKKVSLINMGVFEAAIIDIVSQTTPLSAFYFAAVKLFNADLRSILSLYNKFC